MKRIFLSIVAVCFMFTMVGCETTASTYTTVNYPDSIIIKAFERNGVNPEEFSRRILSVVKAEIAYGRFTRQDVVAFLDDNISKIKAGLLPYDAIGEIIAKYGQRLLLPSGNDVSEAAMIAYYLFMPDLPTFDIPSIVGPQDMEVAVAFLTYIRDGV